MSPISLEGQMLGKYRVLEALGRGGMAQVYRAYHPQLDRYVAIKVLRADLVEHQEFLARFRREAHAVSGLRHPNIVQVFDFDVQEATETYYMVMELLEGDTLRARLNQYRVKGERMPLPEILRILSDVLAGLEYAHREGIIHRDIKPANIMLTKRNQAVLTDFGIAQIVGTTQYTVSGALMGTLNYMAPEQGLQGHCDRRSDIYSLGIVFYEMLTGYTPFDADTPLAILMKHLNDPLPLPSQMDPSLPGSLEHIVLKALAKDPADRYQTATEMAAALEKAAQGEIPAEVRVVVPPPGGISPNAVFSGTARRQITDRHFAEADTDFDVHAAAPKAAADETPLTLPLVLGTFLPRIEKLARPLSPATAVFIALGAFLVTNLCSAMTVSATTINVWNYGWAFEIFLVSALLSLLAWGTQTPWLLLPAIIVFGNASLLGYSSITGRWGDWFFLWMLEPVIVAVAIVLPIWMTRHLPDTRPWARLLGIAFAFLSVFAASAICVLAFIIDLFR